MQRRKNRKNKKDPHYGFLVSWQPSGSTVKGESKISLKTNNHQTKHTKNADVLAQDLNLSSTKKDIIKSLILVSLILTLELVIYLAWNKFFN